MEESFFYWSILIFLFVCAMKILVEYKNKDPNHVEWAKALKELYVPGLRDYVKSHYPLGPVWSVTGKTTVPAPAKAPKSSGPAPPPPPPASLFSSESPQSSSSRPKVGMAAVFQEISTGKPATAGGYSFSVLLFISLAWSIGHFQMIFMHARVEKGHRRYENQEPCR